MIRNWKIIFKNSILHFSGCRKEVLYSVENNILPFQVSILSPVMHTLIQALEAEDNHVTFLNNSLSG